MTERCTRGEKVHKVRSASPIRSACKHLPSSCGGRAGRGPRSTYCAVVNTHLAYLEKESLEPTRRPTFVISSSNCRLLTADTYFYSSFHIFGFDFYFLHGILTGHAALHRTLDHWHTAQREHVLHTKSPLLTSSVLIHITFTSHTVSEIFGVYGHWAYKN